MHEPDAIPEHRKRTRRVKTLAMATAAGTAEASAPIEAGEPVEIEFVG